MKGTLLLKFKNIIDQCCQQKQNKCYNEEPHSHPCGTGAGGQNTPFLQQTKQKNQHRKEEGITAEQPDHKVENHLIAAFRDIVDKGVVSSVAALSSEMWSYAIRVLTNGPTSLLYTWLIINARQTPMQIDQMTRSVESRVQLGILALLGYVVSAKLY